MRVVSTIEQTGLIIKSLKGYNQKIGFIPTMGAIHEGHESLMQRSVIDKCFSIVSIFLNPVQFGASEDLDKYPKPLERDLELCEKNGVSLVFAPDNKEMYPSVQDIFITSDSLAGIFCGASRPGHFRGVLTVVAKLFNIIRPDYAYFGEKDYQQSVLVKNMVRELNFKTIIKTCPTVRQKNGLALSSRNAYLNPWERKKAPCLYQSFLKAENMVKSGNINSCDQLIAFIKNYLADNISNVSIDYIDIVYDNTLERASNFARDIRVLAAVQLGKTRLIDNYRIIFDK